MPYEFQDEFFCFCKKKKIHRDFDRDYIHLLIDLTSMDVRQMAFHQESHHLRSMAQV